MRKTLGCIRRADERYGMIESGDRVAVGVSGGKDSLLLLTALALYRRFAAHPFTLEAITLGMNYPGMDFSAVAAWCEKIEVPYTFQMTDIKEVVFDLRYGRASAWFDHTRLEREWQQGDEGLFADPMKVWKLLSLCLQLKNLP